MRLLAFGSYDAESHPRVAVLLEGLRASGVTVEECNAPLRLDTAARVRLLQEPWRLPRLVVELARSWWVLVRGARRAARPDAVLVGYLGHFDVLLARLLFRGVPVVHDMLVFASDTARDRGAGGVKQRLLAGLDAAAVRASDVVVVDTDEHLRLLPPARQADGVVVPVGVPSSWLGPQPSTRGPTRPVRVVFYGLYTPLQGAPVIGRALALLADEPGLHVTMVGAGQDLETTRRSAARRRRGRRPGRVGRLGAARSSCRRWSPSHDVCLGIFGSQREGAARGAEQGLPGRGRGLRPRHLRHRAAAARARATPPCSCRPATSTPSPRRCAHWSPTAPGCRPCARRRGRWPASTSCRRLSCSRSSPADHVVTRTGPHMSVPPLAANAWLRWDVTRRLVPRDARTVLEIGCGGGGFGSRLSVGRDYLGVEPDPTSAATARARVTAAGAGGEVRRGRVEDVVEPGRQFDLVCAFEVLEHLEDDQAALSAWVEHVRPGGWLLLSTPAFDARMAAWDEVVGHYRRYEPDAVRALLEAHGLVDVEVVVYGVPLGYPLEMARNALGRRRLRRSSVPAPVAETVPATADGAADADRMAQLTSVSGRLFQPSGALGGLLAQAGTAPFRLVQRRFPRSGTGLVARGRRPQVGAAP